MRKRTLWIVVACLALVAGGCSKRHKIQIESNGCWTATVNGDQTFNDCGNASYRVIGTLHCVRARLTSQSGVLRVRIDDRPWSETPDAFGVVQACE